MLLHRKNDSRDANWTSPIPEVLIPEVPRTVRADISAGMPSIRSRNFGETSSFSSAN
jgi:hypothetical protein